MKKTFLVLLSFSFILAPAASNAAYLLLLKNGGRLVTPHYWVEGRQLCFYFAGGIVGVDRGEINRVERHNPEPRAEADDVSGGREKKGPAPAPPLPEAEKVSAAPQAPAEKLDIAAQKRKKDQLTVELNDLLEKRRQAKAVKDMEASKRITEEILNTSSEVYRITDEVKAKNKGKLPEGWWER